MVKNKKIFISHRSIDKDVADMLLDFFSATSLPKDSVFCSSLPGNDVKQKISAEVKQAISDSCVNIIILSNDYYKSAYCLNEEGVIWYNDTPVIVIAMPEITPNNMLGFINSEYKLRCLDNENDIAAIYDEIIRDFSINAASATSLTYAINKLKARYSQFLQTRGNPKTPEDLQTTEDYDDITTDDERVVLYYILSKRVRKISAIDIETWLTENEISNINVANALDLLATAGWGSLTIEGKNAVFELEISHFRSLSKAADEITDPLKETVVQHRRLSKDWFVAMWDTDQFDENDLLFISYIRDENVFSYGDRWMADGQIESIKQWETKHSLEAVLSENYGKCLNKFIENRFVYESSWTSYGNPRAYSLHKSLKTYFLSKDFAYDDKLVIV